MKIILFCLKMEKQFLKIVMGIGQKKTRYLQSSGRSSADIYFRQYECQIIGDEERVFDEKWFDRTWDGELIHEVNGSFLKIYRRGEEYFEEPLYLHVGITVGYDAAYTVTNSSSFSTAAIIATDMDDNRYELPGMKAKLLYAQLVDAYLAIQHKFKPIYSMMECNGPQIGTWESMRKAGLRIRKDANIYEKKVERITTLQAPIMQEKYYFQPNSYATDEAFTFPRGTLDYLDALEKADRVRRRGTNLKHKDTSEVIKRYDRDSHYSILAA